MRGRLRIGGTRKGPRSLSGMQRRARNIASPPPLAGGAEVERP
jgi:hypothetical protein